MTDKPMEWTPTGTHGGNESRELTEQATTEAELFAGYENAGIVLAPAGEVVATLDAIAREVATTRELVELLVDWAGARDKPPADEA